MKWQVHAGDILNIRADVLVCSANVYLTLSGGVGGALLQRYGPAMQESLTRYLADRDLRYVDRGEVIEMPACGSPYLAILHAVAVDGLYETTSTVITDLVAACLRRSSELGARTVVLTALATGYGRKSITFFGQALEPVMKLEFPKLESVVIGVRSPSDAEELHAILLGLEHG